MGNSHNELYIEEKQLTGCTPPTPQQGNQHYCALLLCGKLLALWHEIRTVVAIVIERLLY